MSTWPALAYPPSARRSRSRSPYRGTYPPQRAAYPEGSYPPESYGRGEWDNFDKLQAWADYDRDRAAYDLRRGRSRSPPLEDPGRKRRRSISPYERGRFDPRPRYGDDYDAHSRTYNYASPQRAGQYPAQYGASRRAPPADPHTFDFPASLKQYAEWFRYYYPQEAIEEDNADKAAEQAAGDGTKPRNGIKTRWEKYKKDFNAAQLQRMFDHHRKSPWFAEKYDPSFEYDELRKRVRKEGWQGSLDNFLNDLEAGKYDPELREPELPPISPVKEKEPASANGDAGAAPTSGQDDSGMAPVVEEGKAEEDVQLEGEDEGGDNPATTETNGKASLDPKRVNRGEEVSIPNDGNQVMIRTIPPDIGRLKLEEACGRIPGFVYLALGDPLQKRNYYRAGWLKFREDADMSVVMSELSDKKIEGFKLHVTHNTKPFTNRVRYAPEVSNKPDRLEKDLVNAKALAATLEEEAAALRKFKLHKKEDRPQTEGENANEAQQDSIMAEVSEDGEEVEHTENGSDAVERRIEKVMEDLCRQGVVDVNDEKALAAKKTVVSLDLYLAYLRAAFHTCYYCAVVTDHAEELQRKCIKHVRKPMSKSLLEEVKAAEAEKAERKKRDGLEDEKEKEKEKEKEVSVKEKGSENRDWKRNDERWLEWLDAKIALLVRRNEVDPQEYGGKSYDEELSRTAESFIKQEDEGKFRCKTCQKLFKATSFVEKHILNKHPELVKHLEEIPYFNNFALDPHRIQPFTHPPNNVGGGSQAPPPQAYGLQGPAAYPPPGGDYGRPASYYASYYPPPPAYPNGGYWDPYAYSYPSAAYPPPPASRRDEATTARRLSDRISGYAPGYDPANEPPPMPAAAGLPAKPLAILEPGPGGRRGGRVGGPPPPPPPDAKEDPRAAAGRKVSYNDMDMVAEGDVELTY
ncbi:hypothetical protein JAAARDRAFT_117492 [Jaapia argillacea MUCL 33604]|uniref:C2H2-type domain-containing protein n=1 Tax=Jaapia argillacea MUCL 33604 TaxID=933084 RepID=A0A067QD86_9AGAM|nr:hypothetical protein JAAARDRAFT_117492 [Jaapia argillacea MUCL 33604]